jgi:hypothetical protein
VRPDLVALVLIGALAGCGREPPAAHAQPWPEADALFRGDTLWLGSDGDYSTSLGGDRVLWVFGDSLVARDATRNPNGAYFIHNSLAVQTRTDPSQAFIQFYWGLNGDQPGSFFPEQGEEWFWPSAPARVGSGLMIFAQRVVKRSGGLLGFEGVGTSAFFISNPDDDPTQWQVADAHAPDFGNHFILGVASMIDGDFLYAYGHDNLLSIGVARFAVKDATAGDLSKAEFFQGGRWVPAASFNGSPDALFGVGPPEASIHFEPRVGEYLFTSTEGLGASTLAFRSAPHPEGPWSDVRSFYRPPASFGGNAFVYAGKGHPELQGDGADFVVTYFPSLFSGVSETLDPNDGYARFLKVTF